MYDILDVIKNIQDLYENNSALGALKDFERVLDEMDLYVYDNWIDGELAYGPKVDRHWISVGFMWPRDKMPDPTGAERLMDLGCKITYKKSSIVQPRSIRTSDDIRPGTKKGKLDRKEIWIVEIQMPKKVAFDMYKGYMSKMKEEQGGEKAPEQGTPVPGAAAPAAPAVPASPGMAPAGGAAPAAGLAAAPAVPTA